MPPHTSNSSVVVQVIEGEGIFRGEGHEARLGPGAAVAYAPGELHSMPMEVKEVRPSHPRSYENLAHESGEENFILHLRNPSDRAVRQRLEDPRLERAIGVIYRPDTELQSHYFEASLPRQFHEWIWLDRTEAVTPIGEEHRDELAGLPDTFPFGL